jgi:hypothetical protein
MGRDEETDGVEVELGLKRRVHGSQQTSPALLGHFAQHLLAGLDQLAFAAL